MSQPRVTVTVGQGGQRSATISSGKLYSDYEGGSVAGRKRSVKDRLGSSSRNVSHNGHPMSSKRQRLETGWKQRIYDEEEDDIMIPASLHKVQNPRQDLRYKLDQKISSKSKQISSSSTNVGNDLRERISGPPTPIQGQRIVVRRHPSLPSKAIPLLGSLPAPAAIASRVKAVHKVSVAVSMHSQTHFFTPAELRNVYLECASVLVMSLRYFRSTVPEIGLFLLNMRALLNDQDLVKRYYQKNIDWLFSMIGSSL